MQKAFIRFICWCLKVNSPLPSVTKAHQIFEIFCSNINLGGSKSHKNLAAQSFQQFLDKNMSLRLDVVVRRAESAWRVTLTLATPETRGHSDIVRLHRDMTSTNKG